MILPTGPNVREQYPNSHPVEQWANYLQAQAGALRAAYEEAEARLARFTAQVWSDSLADRRQAAETAADMIARITVAWEPGWPHPWTRGDSAASSAEGWDLFDSSGSANGPWQVQSFDDQDDGINDDEAMRRVRVGALADPHGVHARVLAILAVANPAEHECIVRDVDTNPEVTP